MKPKLKTIQNLRRYDEMIIYQITMLSLLDTNISILAEEAKA